MATERPCRRAIPTRFATIELALSQAESVLDICGCRMPNADHSLLVAADVGNSHIKCGQFAALTAASPLPEPVSTLVLPIDNKSGEFDCHRLYAWCDEQLVGPSRWAVASVHRAAARRLAQAVSDWSSRARRPCSLEQLSYRDVPLRILVREPARVGVDRLMGAYAANRLRDPNRVAIIVDLGTAITVDLVDAAGSFAGGAIMPGIAMAARALAEQTDALPAIDLDGLRPAPAALGDSTVAAMQAGLYWGSIGAIRELATRLSTGLAEPPDIFLTGGYSPLVAQYLREQSPWSVRHVPNLVLAGIALAHQATHRGPDR